MFEKHIYIKREVKFPLYVNKGETIIISNYLITQIFLALQDVIIMSEEELTTILSAKKLFSLDDVINNQ